MTEDTALAAIEPRSKAERELMDISADSDIRAIIPKTIEQVYRLAQLFVAAGLSPDSYGKSVEKVAVAILKSLEVGLPPITGINTIAVINNRPSVFGDGAIALCQAAGVVEKVESFFEGAEGTPEYTAVYRIWRKGQANPYEGRFSRKDAERASLLKKPGPWLHYPNRMLFNRARAYALRDGFADCLSGLAIAEEMQDVTPAPQKADLSFLTDASDAQDELAADIAVKVAALGTFAGTVTELDAYAKQIEEQLAERPDLLEKWNAAVEARCADLEPKA